MARRDDAEEIRQKLNDGIESVLNSLAPGWKKRGNKAYLTPENDKKLGSFTVSLADGQRLPRGSFYRFSRKIGGGSVELVSYLLYDNTSNYKEAFAWARQHLGMDTGRRETEEEREERSKTEEAARVRRETQAKAHAAAVEKRNEKRRGNAAEVWSETVPLAGTHGEAYLVARGIPPISEWPWDPINDLRFHPALDHELERDSGLWPAVVAKVVDSFGDLVAVWQIYLDRDEPIKAKLEPNKVGRGPAAGGAIRLGGDGEHIGGAEGVETALAAWFIERNRYPVWSMMSTSGIASFEPPPFVKRYTGWPDGDRGVLQKQTGNVLEPPGISAQRTIVARLAPIGIKTAINDMCIDGDALDLWNALQKHEGR